MAKGLNKVMIIGHLGQNPDIRYTPGGAAVANITVATNEVWKDKTTQEKQERTEWHRVVFFNRLAEIVGEYLKKGAQVYIEGKLQTRKWQDKQGNDRYTTEIVANNMQMLGGRGDQAAPASSAAPQAASTAEQPPVQSPPPSADFDDDIPF